MKWPFSKQEIEQATEAIQNGDVTQEDMASVTPDVSDKSMLRSIMGEFQSFMLELHGIQRDNSLNRDKKFAELSKRVDALSEATFKNYFPQIMEIIQRNKEYCEIYPDSERQVQEIFRLVPRIKEFDGLALLIIQERRKKYKLKV